MKKKKIRAKRNINYIRRGRTQNALVNSRQAAEGHTHTRVLNIYIDEGMKETRIYKAEYSIW